MTSIQSLVEIITPAIAQRLLDAHEKLQQSRGDARQNRETCESTVERYAIYMARGEWDGENGETIKIAKSGRIVDGKHRLTAIARSGVTIRAIVLRNVSEDAQKTIGVGRMWTASDLLGVGRVGGVKYGTQIAAASRIVMSYEGGHFTKHNMKDMSKANILDFYNKNEELLSRAINIPGSNKIVSKTYTAAWYFVLVRKRMPQWEVDKFFEDLNTGASLNPGDPVLTLREKLIKIKSDKISVREKDLFNLGIKAWNARRAGKKVSYFKIDPESAYLHVE